MHIEIHAGADLYTFVEYQYVFSHKLTKSLILIST